MKRVWWAIGLLVFVVIIGGVIFRLFTRPLISTKQAMATAKEQLKYMGYEPPYRNFAMGSSLGWYNDGGFISTERVYFTTIIYQPKPGGAIINAEVVEDARTGTLISVLQYFSPPGKPLF